jgi:hypothetical protein
MIKKATVGAGDGKESTRRLTFGDKRQQGFGLEWPIKLRKGQTL